MRTILKIKKKFKNITFLYDKKRDIENIKESLRTPGH